MVWRNKHRAGRRKRERIAALQKRPIITAVETGHFLTDRMRQQLRRAAWRAQHANPSSNHNVEIIDLTQETEEIPNLENTEQLESPTAVYSHTREKIIYIWTYFIYNYIYIIVYRICQ